MILQHKVGMVMSSKGEKWAARLERERRGVQILNFRERRQYT